MKDTLVSAIRNHTVHPDSPLHIELTGFRIALSGEILAH